MARHSWSWLTPFGAVVVMATRTLVDPPAAAIAVASLLWLLVQLKVPEPLVIVAAGAIGLLIKSAAAQ